MRILTYDLQQSPDHYGTLLTALLQPLFPDYRWVAESVSLHISEPQIVVIEVMVVQNTKVEP